MIYGWMGMTSGSAQIRFRHLGKKDGFSQSSVFAISQDQEGFIWFGTRNGLNKFDGYQFYTYFNDEADSTSIIANDVRAIYADKTSNHLWIGTLGGLSQYLPEKDKFINYYPAESQDPLALEVYSICKDSEDRLWVGTPIGPHVLDPENQSYSFVPILDKKKEEVSVKVMWEDQQKVFWMGTDKGLFYLKGVNHGKYHFVDGKETYPELNNLSDPHIKSMIEDENGNIWIGTNRGGLNHWDRENNTITQYKYDSENPSSLSHNDVRTLIRDKKNTLWIGTHNGLNKFIPEKKNFQRIFSDELNSESLTDNSIRSFYIDKKGGLWIGTFFGGVNYLDESFSRFNTYRRLPSKNSISNNIVSSFVEDELGNFWIGTEGGGLNYFEEKKNRFSSYKNEGSATNQISGNNIKTLFYDNGKLWIGTFQHGLNLFDPAKKTFTHFRSGPNELSNDNVYGILKDKNALWLATYGGGLNRLNLGDMTFDHFVHDNKDSLSISTDDTRVVFKDMDQDIWVCTDHGVNLMQKDAEGHIYFKRFLTDSKVYSIQATEKDGVWIGTLYKGLFYLNKNTGLIENFTVEDGLPGNTILGILEDEFSNIWLSTNNGLSRFNRARNTFTTYNHADGLDNLEFNFNAYYKAKNGDFFFGSTKGFIHFHPSTIRINTFVPPVVFTNLEVANERVEVGGEDQLLSHALNYTETLYFEHNEANFGISFSSLDYSNPQNNQYRYQMEGIDKEWVQTIGQPKVSYTIQNPGDYVFHLKGANNDGIWNPDERKIKITVLPPIWLTWWAYLIYILLLGIISFAIVRFIRLRQSFRIEHLEKERQEYLHQMKLRFFTNITHEFRTPLTLILGSMTDLIRSEDGSGIMRQKLSSVERNVQRLLNLVNQLLDFRKLETDHLKLAVVKGNLSEFLKEIYLSFQELAKSRNIRYTFEGSEGEISTWFDPDKMEKVFYNLLANAFKFTKNDGEISLKIEEGRDEITINVQDNGTGFKPELKEDIFKRFYEKAPGIAQTQFKSSGIGLSICKQLVELHHGQIFATSQEGQGALFTVVLPKDETLFEAEEIIADFKNSDDLSLYKAVAPTPKIAFASPEVSTSPADFKDRPHLLIIEDNPEVNAYICSLFENDYQISSAMNGAKGLKMASESSPDLIISDVMMPEMDGITLCSKIKTAIETSHIPVILLTAQTASVFRMEGLETGADDYVTKPFQPEELKLKVRNVLQSRLKLREKFGRIHHFDPKKIVVTSTDEVFLEKMMKIMEQYMDDTQFSIEQFAEEMAVSRALLFTKIKALTNKTPNNFIKEIRLKRAAQILEQNKLNIAEVAYSVGFRDPRYFSKCFQQQFQKTPTEYAKSFR